MRHPAYAAPEADGIALDAETCMALLSTCHAGSLACTVRAMPTVVPVTVTVGPEGICVGFNDRVSARLYAGQIVALGAGVAATPRSGGWWVIARGELAPLEGTQTHLVLHARELDGRGLPEGQPGR